MGKRLSDDDWLVVIRRVIKGESRRAVAKEFGITEGAIRRHLNTQARTTVELAESLAHTETELMALPIRAQVQIRTLADDLRSTSENLAAASAIASSNARALHVKAQHKIKQIRDNVTADDMEDLKIAAILTETANKAAQPGLSLLTATKGTVKVEEDQGPDTEVDDFLQKMKRVLSQRPSRVRLDE